MASDRPQIVPRERVLDNQRRPLRERAKKTPSAQERREGNSEKHLALIRKMPCAVCLGMNHTECHHLKSGPARKERGAGMKATDRWVVPLCRRHHQVIERHGSRVEEAWFKACHPSIDIHEIAHALWNGTGDLGRMIRILMAHRAGERRGGGDG